MAIGEYEHISCIQVRPPPKMVRPKQIAIPKQYLIHYQELSRGLSINAAYSER